jgi:hypothetical protein
VNGSLDLSLRVVALRILLSSLVAGQFCWFVASSLWIFPHSLSYFNESIGGPLNGPKHLLGSNVDWGQDFLYLNDWIKMHPNLETIHLAFHGNLDPADFDLEATQPWPARLPLVKSGAGMNVGETAILNSDCYIISANFLHGAEWAARDGAKSDNSNPRTGYKQAQVLKPAAFAGYSLWIFR